MIIVFSIMSNNKSKIIQFLKNAIKTDFKILLVILMISLNIALEYHISFSSIRFPDN
jgi:Na+-driven multidrug efflux pump